MLYNYLLPIILVLALAAYLKGSGRAKELWRQDGLRSLHSLPLYHGLFVAFWTAVPALAIWSLWQMAEGHLLTLAVKRGLPQELQSLSGNEFSLVMNDVKNAIRGDIVTSLNNATATGSARLYLATQQGWQSLMAYLSLGLTILGFYLSYRNISLELRARNIVERLSTIFLMLCSAVAIFTTLGIIMSVLIESIAFFREVPVLDFLLGLKWSPQTAMRVDQAGSSGAFGAVPVFAGTILIALIAMAIAIPIGLLSAIFLSEYASEQVRTWVKPLLEILAGIPTVVYGFFAALTVAPMIRDVGSNLGFAVSSESALAAGLVMGIMIIPFVSSLSDDVIHAVPQSLRDGSLALGATSYETIKNVVIPAALPGIVGSVLLAVSRAIGETMIVVMAAGLSANLTYNPLKAVTTVTVQIVTLLTGDQEFDSAKTLAAFALGLFLFIFTLFLNIIALYVVRRYREQYE
ncbi:phosphate ABC transporter permease subunit PstC [Desulfotalea psychrophila]|uniref:Phosphate transport system permease protein n=1 Tax=Desulfotalea psychrophila (strain LSv54 / DSM 12343) TaxID=177439 RepID=Q6AM13_DESPS|nr:phosphate ABC transporter permease subunit PstC [Desulfotalea psychrophila]CAG36612.1 related to phosphate ABC transporter, permease protein (PstC) [Desulfotalea psychrophila LSv54]